VSKEQAAGFEEKKARRQAFGVRFDANAHPDRGQ
jgi:hypothetical protein